eukprot:3735665-Alexandrium_andersonii.AAC.1
MSASLVGSEMCIRDRVRAPPSARRNICDASVLRRSSSCSWRAMDSKEPVSYTHLTLPTICSV